MKAMTNDQIPVILTVEEGNNLLGIASGFACPEALDTHKYSSTERVLANMEVAMLFRALREASPMVRSKKKFLWFGPEDAYEDANDPVSGRAGKRLIDPYREVRINVDEMGMRGLIWCLITRLHPMSAAISGAADQTMVVWPIARKIDVEEHLREVIGLDKAVAKVIKFDRERKKSDPVAAPKAEPAKA